MRKGGIYLAIGDSTVWNNYESGAIGTDLYATKIANYIKTAYGNIRHLNKGLGGNVSGELLNNAYWWGRIFADLVTIGIGMNDCASGSVPINTFTANVNAVIDKLRLSNPNVIIILCAPNGTNDSNRKPYIASYRTALQGIATDKTTATSPVAYCDFAQANGIPDDSAATYTTDGVHPNKAGHTRLYNVLEPVVTDTAAKWLSGLE